MAVKKGLGRGLNNLIPGVKEQEEKIVEVTADTVLKINDIEPNRNQPRKNFDEDTILELADSIKQYGVIEPIVVTKRDNYYEIIAGERRWRAAKKAGLKEVPVVIKNFSEQEAMEVALIENIQRENLNPLKEGLYSDFSNRNEIAEIVRFKSTAEEGTGDDKWTSFADYVGRMKADQKSIYYITGTDEKNLRASPLLEAYKKKGFEVLIMADDIDDIVIPAYGKYQDYELKDVNRSGSDEELGIDKEEAKKKEEEFKPVQEKIKKALENRVKDVVLSKRLSDSPACVVIDGYDLEHVKEELADVIVYCVDMLDKLGLDVDEIVNAKMAKNEAKYPVEKAKGSAAKYDQL